jgi:hypothetical protein
MLGGNERCKFSSLQVNAAGVIMTTGFFFGAFKYMSRRMNKGRMSTLETVMFGFSNAMILTAVSELLFPANLRLSVLLIDISCWVHNYYFKKKKKTRLPEYNEKACCSKASASTAPDEEDEEFEESVSV